MTASRVPARCAHPVEFERWSQDTDGPREFGPQPPAEDLLGEHHLMDLVIDAMVVEARRFEQGAELRAGFWIDVVDFIGNFVHLCHRAKEEWVFFPALLRGEVLDETSTRTFEREHENARELTLGICNGVQSRDWEQVFRFVSMYVVSIRHHMRNEERALMQPYARALDRKLHDEVLTGFRKVERKTLASRSRQYYIDVARRLCEAAGVEHGLGRW